MSNTHEIHVLNGLIKTTLDSMQGYRDAAEDSETSRSAFFCQMADERSLVASTLQECVRQMGGDPEDDSSVSGAVHRGFMDLKQAVAGKDEKAIVSEVERGEDHIKEKFESALKDDELRGVARQAVEQCFQSVQKGHATASAMKHELA